ncbi:hypothetical protein H4R99_008786, partial [Coemansia sp. RSA 1722]
GMLGEELVGSGRLIVRVVVGIVVDWIVEITVVVVGTSEYRKVTDRMVDTVGVKLVVVTVTVVVFGLAAVVEVAVIVVVVVVVIASVVVDMPGTVVVAKIVDMLIDVAVAVVVETMVAVDMVVAVVAIATTKGGLDGVDEDVVVEEGVVGEEVIV